MRKLEYNVILVILCMGLIRHLSYWKALALQFNLSAGVITQRVKDGCLGTFVPARSMLKFLPERQEDGHWCLAGAGGVK